MTRIEQEARRLCGCEDCAQRATCFKRNDIVNGIRRGIELAAEAANDVTTERLDAGDAAGAAGAVVACMRIQGLLTQQPNGQTPGRTP